MKFLVNHDKKLLIGWSRKCACGTVKKWFCDFSGIYVPEEVSIHDYIRNNKQLLGIEPSFNYREYTKVLVIRNPYARLVSGYVDKVVFSGTLNVAETFGEFVDKLVKGKIKNSHFFLQTGEDFIHLKWNYVIKQESLKFGFDRLNNHFGIEIPLNRLGAMKKKDPKYSGEKPAYLLDIEEVKEYNPEWWFYYNNQIQSRIFSYYKRDFEYFRKLGKKYPNQVKGVIR